MDWYIKVLKKYATFEGRARRKEYWFFVLFNTLITLGLTVIDYFTGNLNIESGLGLLGGIYSLAVLFPSLAVAVRRLHDTNRRGTWLFIIFLPLIGAIVLIVFLVQDSNPGENQFGPNPKENPE